MTNGLFPSTDESWGSGHSSPVIGISSDAKRYANQRIGAPAVYIFWGMRRFPTWRNGKPDWSATRRVRWRLVLHDIRKGLRAGTQSDTSVLKTYKYTSDYWIDAFLEPMSAYDFAELLAVYYASDGVMSGRYPISILRKHVFDALREAANVAAPWLISATLKRLEVDQSWDAIDRINIRVVPHEAAVWLFQHAKARSLLPESLCSYLLWSARSLSASADTMPIVTTAELSAFIARPEIATLTRPAQWRAVC